MRISQRPLATVRTKKKKREKREVCHKQTVLQVEAEEAEARNRRCNQRSLRRFSDSVESKVQSSTPLGRQGNMVSATFLGMQIFAI